MYKVEFFTGEDLCNNQFQIAITPPQTIVHSKNKIVKKKYIIDRNGHKIMLSEHRIDMQKYAFIS